MGILTDIRAKNKILYDIFFDDERLSAIDGDTIEKIGAKVGQSWEIDEWNEAVQKAQSERCMDAAVKLLQARERSRDETERKLKQKGYCAGAVEQVMEKLQDYGYINDARYAQHLAEQTQSGSRPSGKKAVAQKLKMRGIGDELAREVLSQTKEETERENALYWAKKMWPKYPDKTRDKVGQRLASKGFSYDTIRYALRIMAESEAGDSSDE